MKIILSNQELSWESNILEPLDVVLSPTGPILEDPADDPVAQLDPVSYDSELVLDLGGDVPSYDISYTESPVEDLVEWGIKATPYEPLVGGHVVASEPKAPRKRSLAEVARKAYAMLHYQPLREVQAFVRASGIPDNSSLHAKLKAEAGLVGTVYIQASVFEDLKTEAPKLHQRCPTASFVVTTNNQDGATLGLTPVSVVPWGKALRKYAPTVRVASESEAKGALQSALLNPKTKEAQVEVKPKEDSSINVRPEVKFGGLETSAARERRVASEALSPRLRQWCLQGLLSKSEVARLASVDPLRARPAAERLVGARLFSGLNQRGELVGKEANQSARVTRKVASATQMDLEQGQRALMDAVASGSLSSNDVSRIMAHYNSDQTQSLTRLASLAIHHRINHFDWSVLASVKTATGTLSNGGGVVQTRRQAEVRLDPIAKAAKAGGVSLTEAQAVMSWVEDRVAEGHSSRGIRALFGQTFTSKIRGAMASCVEDTIEGLKSAPSRFETPEVSDQPLEFSFGDPGALIPEFEGMVVEEDDEGDEILFGSGGLYL